MSPSIQKMIADAVILSAVLERMVRFLITGDVLKQYSNSLPNNKWLGVKYVLIVFGKTYVKGELLMISLTSINTVCSSSKWLQKNKWLEKKREVVHPLCPPLNPPLNS